MLQELNVADWLIIGLVTVSALVSLLRGFVKEALSMVAWIAALMLATMFYPELQVLLADYLPHELLQQVAAFLLIFVITLLAASLLNYLIAYLLKLGGLGFVDRLLGTVFGLVRGGIIALVMVMVLDMVLPAGHERPAWFVESQLIPQLMMLQDWARETAGYLLEQFFELTAAREHVVAWSQAAVRV